MTIGLVIGSTPRGTHVHQVMRLSLLSEIGFTCLVAILPRDTQQGT
jgi:hypothetical protein